MMERIRLAYGVLFALLIPVVLITTNLRFISTAPQVYEASFDKYDVSAATGISSEELSRVAGELVDYFKSDQDSFQTQVVIGGQRRDLFNEREVAHFQDVKGLLKLGDSLWIGALLLTLGYVIFLFLRWRGQAWPSLAWPVAMGGGLTLLLGLGVGVGAAVGFDQLFLQFHLIGFSNDLWLARPGDIMTKLFPEGFFYDATRLLIATTAIEALIMTAISGGYLLWRKKAQRS